MSSESALDQASKAIDKLSETLSALRERCSADGTPPPGLPRICTHLIAHATNVSGLVSKARDDSDVDKKAMERTIAIFEGQRRETGTCDLVERLKLSVTEKENIIETHKASLAEKEAELKQEQKKHSDIISDMKERHSMQMDILWEKIHQLTKNQDRGLSGLADLSEARRVPVSMPKVGPVNIGKGASTSSTNSADDDYIYILDSNEGMEEAERVDEVDNSGSKRSLASKSGVQAVKKPRMLRTQVSGSGHTTDGGTTNETTLQITRDTAGHVSASDNVHRLWNMFVCAWDVSEDEKQSILRQFDGVFVRGRDFESVIQRIETHIVGGFNKTPAYPRCCLLADLKNHSHGNGGLSIAKSCPYCKVDRDRICLWASYVPGVQPTYGSRLGGIISGDARQYNDAATPWTVRLGATHARWVLHKRRMDASHSVVNAWVVGGVSITFDSDPLAG